jgi:hypothetical protein
LSQLGTIERQGPEQQAQGWSWSDWAADVNARLVKALTEDDLIPLITEIANSVNRLHDRVVALEETAKTAPREIAAAAIDPGGNLVLTYSSGESTVVGVVTSTPPAAPRRARVVRDAQGRVIEIVATD